MRQRGFPHHPSWRPAPGLRGDGWLSHIALARPDALACRSSPADGHSIDFERAHSFGADSPVRHSAFKCFFPRQCRLVYREQAFQQSSQKQWIYYSPPGKRWFYYRDSTKQCIYSPPKKQWIYYKISPKSRTTPEPTPNIGSRRHPSTTHNAVIVCQFRHRLYAPYPLVLPG